MPPKGKGKRPASPTSANPLPVSKRTCSNGPHPNTSTKSAPAPRGSVSNAAPGQSRPYPKMWPPPPPSPQPSVTSEAKESIEKANPGTTGHGK